MEKLLLLLMGMLVGATCILWIRDRWIRWRLHRRWRRGVRSEAKASRILSRYGYSLTVAQEPIRASILINGQRKGYEIRPDGFAKRKRKLYAVEVKTGKVAPNPLFRETRRQILEYYHAAPVDGVLLVNADAETVHHIAFDRAEQTKRSLWLWILPLLAAIAIAWWFYV